MVEKPQEQLKKRLGLFDVYALSTGAMFASGFFLLPGVAAAKTGPSVVLAYAIASLLMVPATLAIAELSTTMPRAGGPYYFIDRSFGPVMGTIGGLGAWMVLILKSSFALVGMGAYLGLLFAFPMEPVAIALTLAFAVLNILGAKQGARLQQVLVVALVALMVLYVANGLWWIGRDGFAERTRQQMTPFLPFGTAALFSTVGMVFVSFAGLTKVASVSEEVDHPERNLPLGMIAALLSVTVIYVLGIYVIVAVLPSNVLHGDLTPIATAGQVFAGWLPQRWGTVLIVIAAVAAFASTGNAGLLAASRIPLAMARDGLMWAGFDRVGRFGTPMRAVLATAGLMIAAILLLDVESLARLASAFLLLIFALLNLAVIVMRESRIESYVPVFRVPLYPWMPLAGILLSLGLIGVLGWFYLLFLVIVILLALLWYQVYAAKRVSRRGAVYNVFARLAKRKHEPLEEELWNILQERSPSEQDLYDEVVARALVLEFHERLEFDRVVQRVGQRLADCLSIDAGQLTEQLRESGGPGGPPIASEAVLIDLRVPSVPHPCMALVRLRAGSERRQVEETVGNAAHPSEEPTTPVIHAALFLISPDTQENQHLRIMAALSARIEEPGFLELWQHADSPQQLREVFLRSNRFMLLRVHQDTDTGPWVGKEVADLQLPGNCQVAAIHHGGDAVYPNPRYRFQDEDRLTIVGDPDAIAQAYERFGPVAPNDGH